MRQLTGLDASFLHMETGRFTGHVGGLVLLDPSGTPSGTVTADDIRQSIQARLHLLEPFRWKLVEVPFDLDHPYWVEADDFDLEFHVREVALPAPGNREQLAEEVARITARPLDRSRPLWEMHVIQGLDSGYVGLQTKIHHAAVDGASGSEILSVLFDKQPEPDVPPPNGEWKPEPAPTEMELVTRALVKMVTQPFQAVSTMGRITSTLAQMQNAETPDADGGVLDGPAMNAPRVRFNAQVTPHRRYAFASVDLGKVKKVKNAVKGTVNDVVLAMCAGALRRWLQDHGELPDKPLVVAVPVSVRTEEEKGTYGNKVSMMMAALPTNEPDPRRRLELMHEAMKGAKERHGAVPATLMQDMQQFMPPALAARAARVGTQMMSELGTGPVPFNLIVSNVPGPQHALYVAGARVMAHHIVSGIGDGMGLNISLLGLDGHLDFGLVGDRDLMPDLWKLMDYLDEEADILLEAVDTPAEPARATTSTKKAAPASTRKAPAKKKAPAARKAPAKKAESAAKS